MKKILLVIITSLLCGCGGKIQYYPVYQVKLIERPNPPVLLELDEQKHLGNVDNVDKMLENIIRLMDYTEALNDTIDKYEIQGKDTLNKEIKND